MCSVLEISNAMGTSLKIQLYYTPGKVVSTSLKMAFVMQEVMQVVNVFFAHASNSRQFTNFLGDQSGCRGRETRAKILMAKTLEHLLMVRRKNRLGSQSG